MRWARQQFDASGVGVREAEGADGRASGTGPGGQQCSSGQSLLIHCLHLDQIKLASFSRPECICRLASPSGHLQTSKRA